MNRNPDFAALENDWGIYFRPEASAYIKPEYRRNFALAMDAEPTLITAPNSGIPAFLTTMVDPSLIEVLQSPLKFAELFGEARKGDWTMQTAMFPMVEHTSEVSSYGDYSANGRAGVNTNFPQRQAYLYQVISEKGELEIERMGNARISWSAEVDKAAVKGLNRFQDITYALGVAGLQNYGWLNDPNLSAALQPGPKAYGSAAHGPWVTSGVVTATPIEIYTDIQSMYLQLVSQANGIVELSMETPLLVNMSPTSQLALTATSTYNQSVEDLLKKSFPNIRFGTSVRYNTAAGQLVQMIAMDVGGVGGTGYCGFNEKLRMHPVIRDLSSYRQKMTQGTWGAIIPRPFLVSQMLGV